MNDSSKPSEEDAQDQNALYPVTSLPSLRRESGHVARARFFFPGLRLLGLGLTLGVLGFIEPVTLRVHVAKQYIPWPQSTQIGTAFRPKCIYLGTWTLKP